MQEAQYEFPYHHLVSIRDNFSQSQTLFWGFIYRSYIEYVLDYVHTLRPSSVLDVGCGDGKFTYELRKQSPTNTTILGIDYSEHAIRFARAFDVKGAYNTVDMLSEISDQSSLFEVATLIEVLEHIEPNQIQTFLKNICKFLTTNGYLIITVPSDTTPTNPKHFQHFNKQTIKKTIENFFEIERIEYLNKQSPVVSILQRMFSNRMFILNSKTLNDLLYKIYKKYFTHTKSTGTRLFIVARKKI